MVKSHPQVNHIVRKDGVYYYRRRLPSPAGGEVCLSLRTKRLREAEYRAELLDRAFGDALRRVEMGTNEPADLNAILRTHLARGLEDDLLRRTTRPPHSAIYAHWWEHGDPETAQEADLLAIRNARASLARDLAANSPDDLAEGEARRLVELHGLPKALLRPLAIGLLEAFIRRWDVAERRTLGLDPLVFDPSAPSPQDVTPPPAPPNNPPPPSGPPASSLVDLFSAWGLTSKGWRKGAAAQAATSLRLFIEVCGDSPIDGYQTADADTFRTTLRRLPSIYRKSAEDKGKTVADIIATADATGAKRIAEKTAKRHFWALSQFFVFLSETGRLPRSAENIGRGFSFNTKGSARQQRSMWSGGELRALFLSPVWRGSNPRSRAKSGPVITRDAMFWLPLLGLYQGTRLEELAQLRREDVGIATGVWFLRVSDADGRQLKNAQSRRDVPLHPELIRLGFLDHVAGTTVHSADPVFLELRPGGRDAKLGFSFSKRFSTYRNVIGIRRPGLDYHSFRHGVTTKLYEAEVNEGWIDLLTGHESGGESRRRYLKGIPLPALKEAIARVVWPEVDLSALYVREAGDERWPVTGVAAA